MASFQDPYSNSDYISSFVSGQVSGGFLIGSGDGSNTVPRWSASSTNLALNFTATSITGMGYTQQKGGGSIARLQFSSDGSNIKGPDGSDLKIGSYWFDGINRHIEIPGDSSIDNLPQGDGFTCSVWVNPGSITNEGTIFSKGPLEHWVFQIDGTSLDKAKLKWTHSAATTTYQVQSDEGELRLNEWSHVCFKWDGNTATALTCFVNGGAAAVTRSDGSGAASTTTASLFIGIDPAGDGWGGLISDMIWWGSELTDAQMKNIFLEGKVPAGYAARWKLDGNGDDSSANGNDATTVDAVSSTNIPDVGYQLAGSDQTRWDGVNDNIELSHNATLDYTGSTTLSAWIMVEDSFGSSWNDQPIWSKWHYLDNSGGYGIGLMQNRVYVANFQLGGDAIYAADTDASVIANLDEWYHVCVVMNTGLGTNNFPIYVNGVEYPQSHWYSAGNPQTYIQGGVAEDVQIGGGDNAGYFFGTTEWFGGKIANLAYFQSGLSEAEVVELYQKGSPDMTNTSLKGYWPLDGSYVDRAGDVGNASNNGTYTSVDAFRPTSGIAQKTIDVTDLSLSTSFYYNHVSTKRAGFGARLDEINLHYAAVTPPTPPVSQIGNLAKEIASGYFSYLTGAALTTQISDTSGWLTVSMGQLNNLIYTSYSGASPNLGLEEASIYTQLYLQSYYTSRAKKVLRNIGNDADWIRIAEGDTTIVKTNKNEVSKSYRGLAKASQDMTDNLVASYHQYLAQPVQVAGTDGSTGVLVYAT
jgi:hypothetical protein